MPRGRLMMLYFGAGDRWIYDEIRDYARKRNLSFNRAVWELVDRGLVANGV